MRNTGSDTVIRLALIDDHSSYRDALGFMLGGEADLTIVAEAGTVAEGHALLGDTPIDVVLVDLDLPDGYGLELLPVIQARNPEAAAIVLSGSTRPEDRALAVAAGASGFVPKNARVEEIVRAIRRVAAGELLFSTAEAIRLMRQAAAYQAHHQAEQQVLGQLTPREREVLQAIAAGLDNEAIGQRLYLTTATVRTHVVNIFRKLGVTSRLQAALLAVRHGLIDADETG